MFFLWKVVILIQFFAILCLMWMPFFSNPTLGLCFLSHILAIFVFLCKIVILVQLLALFDVHKADTFSRIRHWVCLFFLCSYLCVIRMKSCVLIQSFLRFFEKICCLFANRTLDLCFLDDKVVLFYCGIHLDCMFGCGFFLMLVTCCVACGLIQSKTWSPANLRYLQSQIWPRFLLHDLFICMCISVSFFILNCLAVE